MKKLYRTEGPDAKICGVCGGVAEYFAMDPKVVRVIWAALALFGPAALAYLIAALVLPEKGKV